MRGLGVFDIVHNEFGAQRVDGVQGSHLAFRVPPDLGDVVEFGDFLIISVGELGHG
jgi:hypothetical protein